MFTCSKAYSDIPFAHRQHRHPGHCRFVHGHNWGFEFTFGCRELDENGFVVDFGGLGYVREWLLEKFDHACVLNEDDPLRDTLIKSAPDAWKPVVVPNCSAEGLAEFVYNEVNPMVRERTGERVWIVRVEVREDSRNAAAYRPSGQ